MRIIFKITDLTRKRLFLFWVYILTFSCDAQNIPTIGNYNTRGNYMMVKIDTDTCWVFTLTHVLGGHIPDLKIWKMDTLIRKGGKYANNTLSIFKDNRKTVIVYPYGRKQKLRKRKLTENISNAFNPIINEAYVWKEILERSHVIKRNCPELKEHFYEYFNDRITTFKNLSEDFQKFIPQCQLSLQKWQNSICPPGKR